MRMGVTRRGFLNIAGPVAALLATFPTVRLRAETALRLSLEGRIDATSAPFFVALERGYFKAEGLHVIIEPSNGGLEPITRITSGAFDLGVGDFTTMIRYRDQNASAMLKAVFVVNNWPSYAVIGRKSRGVAILSDLAGKRLGAPTAENASAAWPILAKLNNIDPSTVRVLTIGVPVREPMLAAGEVDAVTGTAHSTPIALREKGVPADDITTLLMARHGIELYGSAIIAGNKTLAEKPEAVTAFLRALARGLKDTLREPSAALAPVLARMTGGNREIELERLQTLIRTSIVTPEVGANGMGAVDPARLERAIEQIGMVYSFKTKPKPADIFDPSFLPPDAERRLE